MQDLINIFCREYRCLRIFGAHSIAHRGYAVLGGGWRALRYADRDCWHDALYSFLHFDDGRLVSSESPALNKIPSVYVSYDMLCQVPGTRLPRIMLGAMRALLFHFVNTSGIVERPLPSPTKKRPPRKTAHLISCLLDYLAISRNA